MNTDFAFQIENWYAEHGRELPWRQTHDAYRIWVSEIILQQTRVAQGLDYYERFVGRFPNVRSLAEASEDEVLRLWQGLGYYSRARNMHRAAKQVMERGGVFPDTFEGVRSLQGIGDYTASAIMSFAYGQPYAVLDGNVYRVLARTQGIDTPIDSTQGRRLFSALSQELLDASQPALYNQAIMDFGALQCIPKGCDCQPCPLRLQCVAFREDMVNVLPVKGHRVSVTERHLIYISVQDNEGHMLLHRREAGDIWQGLYELPCVDDIGQTAWVDAMVGKGAQLILVAQGVKHQLTHRTLLADYYTLQLPGSLPAWLTQHGDLVRDLHWQCIDTACRDDYAMPRLLLSLLAKGE